MIKRKRNEIVKYIGGLNKYYLNQLTKAILVVIYILLLVSVFEIEAVPFSFELLVKSGSNFVSAKKIDNEYYILFEKQQFGFQIIAKQNGFISLWYKNEEALFPYPVGSERIIPVKAGKVLLIKSAVESNKPFLAINVENTDYYFVIFSESKQKLKSLIKKKKLFADNIKSLVYRKIELEISPRIPIPTTIAQDCNDDKYLIKIRKDIRNKKIINNYNNIYLLSLSANTSELHRTHLDSCRFTKVITDLFDIPDKNIRLYKDVSRKNFISGLNWLKETVKTKKDLVILYFSGHGSTYPQIGDEEKDGYDEVLITQDQKEQVKKKLKDEDIMIRDNYLYKELAQLSTEQILSVIDSCHAGGTAREPKGSVIKSYQKGNFGKKGLLTPSKYCKSLSGKGVLFAASEEGKTTLELSNGGEFTLALLDTIAKSKSKESLDEIFLKVNGSGNPCIVGNRRIIKNLVIVDQHRPPLRITPK